jgi:uncharacterized coiled-coil protein SlyX
MTARKDKTIDELFEEIDNESLQIGSYFNQQRTIADRMEDMADIMDSGQMSKDLRNMAEQLRANKSDIQDSVAVMTRNSNEIQRREEQ